MGGAPTKALISLVIAAPSCRIVTIGLPRPEPSQIGLVVKTGAKTRSTTPWFAQEVEPRVRRSKVQLRPKLRAVGHIARQLAGCNGEIRFSTFRSKESVRNHGNASQRWCRLSDSNG